MGSYFWRFVSKEKSGCVSEIPWCYSLYCVKCPCKVVGVVESTFQSNLCNGQIRGLQQFFCTVDAQSVDVFDGRGVIQTLENGNESVFGETGMSAQIFQGDGRGEILVDIVGDAGIGIVMRTAVPGVIVVGPTQKTDDLHKKCSDDQFTCTGIESSCQCIECL